MFNFTLLLDGINTTQEKISLDECYEDFISSETTIRRWYAELKRDRRDSDDAEPIGRSNEAVEPENIEKIHKIVLNDRKVKLHELTDILKVPKERVGFILHEHLSMRNLCSKGVPRFLTVMQKQQHVNDFKQYLVMFKRSNPEFLLRYVTMD